MPRKLCFIAPASEVSPWRPGRRNEQKKPTAMPPTVISSGMIRCSKSIKVAAIKPATFIDFEHLIIPDEITVGGMAVGFFCSFLLPGLQGETSLAGAMKQSFLGIAVGAGLIYAIVRGGKLVF